jgi:hypothetical protein
LRKTAYRLFKKAQKMAKKHDFREKNAQKAKNHVCSQNISKTMDKMISWVMSAPFLIMPVTLQGIKNTWAGKIASGGPGGQPCLLLSLLSLARP